MKKILFTLAMLISVAYGQSTLYLRGDSVMLQKTNGNSELIILNGSRTVTNGILTNIGNGRTRFLPIDSFSVGGTLNNIGSGFDLAVEGTSSVKSLTASNGLTADSATEGQVGVKLGGTLDENTTITAHHYPLALTWDSLTTAHGLNITSSGQATGNKALVNIGITGTSANHSYGLRILQNRIGTGQGSRNIGIYSELGADGSAGGGAAIVAYNNLLNNTIASALVARAGRNTPSVAGLAESWVAWFRGDTLDKNRAMAVFERNDTGAVNKSEIKNSATIHINSIASKALTIDSHDEPNGDNYSILSYRGRSAFLDTTFSSGSPYAHPKAIVEIGRSTMARPSLNIHEGVAPSSPRDGDMWHTDDSLYFQSGGNTYNLTHLTEGAAYSLQTVIDNGATLDKANTVDQADFLLTWLGPNRWYDSTATQVSIRDFNSGIDYLTYTPILGDTVINFTQDVVNGIKMNATDGSETHYLQVKGNGIYAGGLVFNDGAALRGIAIDTTTGKFYTVPLGGSSSTPGIDDVLAVGQSLTASRSVDLDGESVSFSDGFNTTSIGATTFSSQYTASGFTHSTTLTNYEDYFQALTANQGSTRSVLIETNKDWFGKIGVIAPGGTSYLRVDSTQVEINTSNLKLTGRVFSDAASLRSLVIDTTTGLVYTAPLSSGGGSSISFGTDNQIPYMNSDGDDFDYSDHLTFDGQSMVVTNTNAAFSTNYILTIAGEEGNDAAMLRLKGSGNRSAYIGLGASDHMIFKNNHATSATAGFNFMNRLGASVASFTNTVAHLPFGVIINEAGGDFDFRVESDGDTHNIFSDGGTNQVGIGTSTLTEKLTVNGNIAASGGKVGVSLDNDVTPVSTTGSSEENLITYALPAGKLATDGDYLEVSASFLVQTVSDKIYLKFGSANVVEWTAGNIGTYMVHGTITRTGAATQEARFMIVGEDTGVSITSPTETLSSGITIAGAAEVGGSSATQYNLNVKYYPAN